MEGRSPVTSLLPPPAVREAPPSVPLPAAPTAVKANFCLIVNRPVTEDESAPSTVSRQDGVDLIHPFQSDSEGREGKLTLLLPRTEHAQCDTHPQTFLSWA